MLKIVVPKTELNDPETGDFYYTKETVLTLEHSLVSLSKWESKWKIPFLNNNHINEAQLRDYIRCMTLTQNVDPMVYHALTQENLTDVLKYIEDPMTATTITEKNTNRFGPATRGAKIITNELIYYWMTALNIPFECQKWHLNRLMTLIRVASIEQQPPKKMNPRSVMAQNKSLNAARRARLGSKG